MHVLCMDWMNLEQGNVMCELSMGCQDGVCTRLAGNQTKGRGNQRGEYACVCGAVSLCVRVLYPAGISTSSHHLPLPLAAYYPGTATGSRQPRFVVLVYAAS